MGFKCHSMIQSQTIKLDGIIYDRINLDKLFTENEPKDSWWNAIYFFLRNWFDDSNFILAQTSGSTGKPKNIQLSKQSMMNSARMTNEFFGLDASKTALLCLPASYIAGKMMLVRAIVGSFNLKTVEPSANPFTNLETEINFTAITPYQLFHSAETLKTKFVRKIIVGGSPVNAKLEKLSETIPAELFETYGMTETFSHIALRRLDRNEKSDYFTVLNGVEIHQDERDCLVIKASHLLEEEIITNDIVEIKDKNSFRWLGRFDSVINSGGVKIHPEQVEKKLEGIIPTSYFITSISDEYLENKVIVVIESEPYTLNQESDLRLKLEEVLSKFEVPKQIFFLPAFVYSKSNKVLKKETLANIISR
jgi:o-succinylbenzoate---CoA ligase